MLFRPIIRIAPWSIEASREETFTIGSPSVFQTAPPQPASNARSTIDPIFVGGAEASQKGLGDLIPAKLMLRSAMVSECPWAVFRRHYILGIRFGIVFNTDRKSTRLNSSHSQISYAVFCLKKKKTRDCA